MTSFMQWCYFGCLPLAHLRDLSFFHHQGKEADKLGCLNVHLLNATPINSRHLFLSILDKVAAILSKPGDARTFSLRMNSHTTGYRSLASWSSKTSGSGIPHSVHLVETAPQVVGDIETSTWWSAAAWLRASCTVSASQAAAAAASVSAPPCCCCCCCCSTVATRASTASKRVSTATVCKSKRCVSSWRRAWRCCCCCCYASCCFCCPWCCCWCSLCGEAGHLLVADVYAGLEVSKALEGFADGVGFSSHLLLLKEEERGEGHLHPLQHSAVWTDGVAESCKQVWSPVSLRMHSHHFFSLPYYQCKFLSFRWSGARCLQYPVLTIECPSCAG